MPNIKARRRREERPPRKCSLCVNGVTYVDYKDVRLLRQFISDRGKIRSARVTGACRQHQRAMATAIKNAREMALLPYSSVALTPVKN